MLAPSFRRAKARLSGSQVAQAQGRYRMDSIVFARQPQAVHRR